MDKVNVKIYQQKEDVRVLDRYRQTESFVDMMFGKKLITKDDFDVCYGLVSSITVQYEKSRDLGKEEYPYNILEKVWYHFNVLESAQDKGRIRYSISVLDVIEIDGEKYQVMGIGHAKLEF